MVTESCYYLQCSFSVCSPPLCSAHGKKHFWHIWSSRCLLWSKGFIYSAGRCCSNLFNFTAALKYPVWFLSLLWWDESGLQSSISSHCREKVQCRIWIEFFSCVGSRENTVAKEEATCTDDPLQSDNKVKTQLMQLLRCVLHDPAVGGG